ncbi:MAG TPA: type II secretion system F family protein [Bacillota bacterium]|nr:type II secretion system F family protein [Bacillota bacterium]HPZ90282.1 type II secretion system F family protein [Bacillota bacterium]HQE01787.1 type II secretion system F family protein [Bacillota bacterium]
MPNVYSYRARDMSGKVVRGQIQADDMNRAAELIRSRRMVILELAPGRTRKKEFPLFKKKTIPLKEFAVFCRQMSTMTNAGVTIMSSISAIATQAENPLLAEVLTDVGKELESGKTFSEACAKHKDFFPNIFISMVEAGEASGALDDVLGRMAEYFENQSEIREKVKSATTYPTFIGVAAVAVVIVLMTTVIPGFASMFAEGGQDLPGITVAMMAASNFMQKYFYIIVPALIVAAIAFKQWSATTKGRHTLQRLSIRLPKFGTIFRNSAIGRFCRSLSILVASGVPMIQALEIVARVVNNVEYSSAILHARKGVSEGMTLSQGLSNSPHFTPLVLHMLKVGEEAGALDDMLAKVADFYEAEVKYTVDRLSSIIEPIMILGLAVIVGIMLASVMLPMFDMGSMVQ